MTEPIEYTPSEMIIKEFPEFNKIKIYGTAEDPLFPITQIQEFLGIGRVRVEHGYTSDDYVKLFCHRRDGQIKEQNLFTEEGLYKVMYKTNSITSQKFRKFIKIVMRQLRIYGQASLSDALEKLKTETFTTEEIKNGNDLYIMKCQEHYKIGRSNDVQCRLSTLQTGNAEEITILISWKDLGKHENDVHDKAKTVMKHLRGEWFSGDINLIVEWINEQY